MSATLRRSFGRWVLDYSLKRVAWARSFPTAKEARIWAKENGYRIERCRLDDRP
jgi:hypothetical protein